jgi:hypothetical protein
MEERTVTMIDEIYDRNYASARAELNSAILGGLRRAGRAIGNAFEVLNRIEYQTPWAAKARRARSH